MNKETLAYFENILTSLFENYDFIEFLQKNIWGSRWTSTYSSAIKKDLKLEIKQGAFKIVFIPIEKDFPYVLKIGKREGSEEVFTEYNNYERACEEGVSHFFSSTYYKGVFHRDGYSLDFIVSEKLEVDENEFEYRTSSLDYDDDDEEEDWRREVEEIFLCNYKEEEVEKLIDFLESNSLSDIHSENIGFIENIPYIIDYS